MGVIEELGDEDVGICPVCSKTAENKCTACKEIFYCNRECQKKHWKTHKFECKSLPYKVIYTNAVTYDFAQCMLQGFELFVFITDREI